MTELSDDRLYKRFKEAQKQQTPTSSIDSDIKIKKSLLTISKNYGSLYIKRHIPNTLSGIQNTFLLNICQMYNPQLISFIYVAPQQRPYV